jgi:hypothetical protein
MLRKECIKMILLKETAKILGVGEHTLKRWVDEKRIECNYVNNEMVFEEKEVDDFIRKTGIKLVKPELHTEALMRELKLNNIQNNSIIDVKNSQLDIDKFLSEMSVENNTLDDEKIKKLFENA